MLQSKCIRSEIEDLDGVRISIMSRHTLNDGVTPDPTISNEMYDWWWYELSPPLPLLGDYYKRGLTWTGFEERYNDHLNTPDVKSVIHSLATLALHTNVTVLCIEDTPWFCHRRLVVEQCQLLVPEISVRID